MLSGTPHASEIVFRSANSWSLSVIRSPLLRRSSGGRSGGPEPILGPFLRAISPHLQTSVYMSDRYTVSERNARREDVTDTNALSKTGAV